MLTSLSYLSLSRMQTQNIGSNLWLFVYVHIKNLYTDFWKAFYVSSVILKQLDVETVTLLLRWPTFIFFLDWIRHTKVIGEVYLWVCPSSIF